MENLSENQETKPSHDFPLLQDFFDKCGENIEHYLRETTKFTHFLQDDSFANIALTSSLACDEAVVYKKLTYIQATEDWKTRRVLLRHLEAPLCLLNNLLYYGQPLKRLAAPLSTVSDKIRQRIANAIVTTLKPSQEKQSYLNTIENLYLPLAEERYTLGEDSCSQAQKAALQNANICSAIHFWDVFFSENQNRLEEWLDTNNLSPEEKFWFEKYYQELHQNKTLDTSIFLEELRKILLQRDETFKQMISIRRKVFCEATKTSDLLEPYFTKYTYEYRPLKMVLEELLEKTKPLRSQSEKSIFFAQSPLKNPESDNKKVFCEWLGQMFVFDPTVSEFHVLAQPRAALFIHAMLISHLSAFGFQLQKAFEKWSEKKMKYGGKSMQTQLESIKIALNDAIRKTLEEAEEDKVRKVVRFADDEQKAMS